MSVQKLKTLESLWSLWNLVWAAIAEWGIQAAGFAMLGAIGIGLYSAGSWINSFGAAGWVVAAFAAITGAALMVGTVAQAITRVKAARPAADRRTDPAPATADVSDNALNMMLRLHKELHDTVSGFESKLESDLRTISERLEAKTETIAYLLKEAKDDMAKAVTDFGSQITALNGRIDAVTNSLREENTKLHERIFALKALYEMRRLRRDIDRFIVLLERPLKQPKENREWGDWSNRFGKFSRAMHKFSTIAAIYNPDEAGILTRKDPSVYRLNSGDFEPDNFPNPETAHDFKTFRQMRESYESLADSFESRLDTKA